MSKKHYAAIAKVLRENTASTNLIWDMAQMLAADNPRFDEHLFIMEATA